VKATTKWVLSGSAIVLAGIGFLLFKCVSISKEDGHLSFSVNFPLSWLGNAIDVRRMEAEEALGIKLPKWGRVASADTAPGEKVHLVLYAMEPPKPAMIYLFVGHGKEGDSSPAKLTDSYKPTGRRTLSLSSGKDIVVEDLKITDETGNTRPGMKALVMTRAHQFAVIADGLSPGADDAAFKDFLSQLQNLN
jgi:hypothetical protein